MAKYNHGDCVKFECAETDAGYCEWLWMIVDFCNDDTSVIFGRLDSVPIVITQLRLGQGIAVSFENVRDVLSHSKISK